MQRSLSILVAAAIAATGGTASFSPSLAMPRSVPVATEAGPAVELVRERRGRNREWRNRHRGDDDDFRRWRGWDDDDGFRRHRRGWDDDDGFRHHRRYRNYGYYRHHDDGAAFALGMFGLATGLIVGSQLHQPRYAPSYGYGSSWQEACARRYRSFDWGSGTYMGYDGYRHRCVLR